MFNYQLVRRLMNDGIESSRFFFNNETSQPIAGGNFIADQWICRWYIARSKFERKFSFDKLRVKYNCKPIKRRSSSCSNRTMTLTSNNLNFGSTVLFFHSPFIFQFIVAFEFHCGIICLRVFVHLFCLIIFE